MKLSHAVWGHPRWTSHGGKVWHNVVHLRKEWQTTSVFLPWEPHEQYEKAKDKTLKDELPGSVGAQYASGDQWRNNSRKNEGMEPKHKQHPVVDGTEDRSKVWCCKEQYCIGTWNVRSMNQGKLEVIRQEMGMTECQHSAAATKLLQSCPTLCDPIDGSPPGFPSLGFSRQEHWSELSFPSQMHESEKWKGSRSVVSDSWTVACQPPLSMRIL